MCIDVTDLFRLQSECRRTRTRCTRRRSCCWVCTWFCIVSHRAVDHRWYRYRFRRLVKVHCARALRRYLLALAMHFLFRRTTQPSAYWPIILFVAYQCTHGAFTTSWRNWKAFAFRRCLRIGRGLSGEEKARKLRRERKQETTVDLDEWHVEVIIDNFFV